MEIKLILINIFFKQDLYNWIGPNMPTDRTISTEKKLLAAIWILGNQESFRGVADRFALNKGSLYHSVMTVCETLSNLREEVFTWPSAEQYPAISEQFSVRCGMPGVVGVLDGTHIHIPGPSEHRDSYINRKGYPSMHLQVVCDKSLAFLDVFTGWPGSVHDSRVFYNSPLRERLEAGFLPPQYHLLGDSAYALNNYLLVPFRDNGHLTNVEKKFNTMHSSTRVEIEMAIGLLKAKFRRLKF